MNKGSSGLVLVSLLIFCVTLTAMGWLMSKSGLATPKAGSKTYYKTSGFFDKQEDGEEYQIQRKFYDFENKLIPVNYRVEQTAYEDIKNGFGFNPDEVSELVLESMEALVEEFVKKYQIALQVKFKIRKNNGMEWLCSYNVTTKKEEKTVKSFIKNLGEYYNYFANEFYQEKGFRISYSKLNRSDLIVPDYGRLVKLNAPALKDLIQAIYDEAKAKEYGERDFMGMVLAYCQEIPYQSPPDEADGKKIYGLIPPVQMDVENWGDCDCKSTLFATLWSMYAKKNTVLISVPGHMFAAVKGKKQFSTDLTLDINGESYICLEPVGPGKLPIGSVADFTLNHIKAGNYEVYPGY